MALAEFGPESAGSKPFTSSPLEFLMSPRESKSKTVQSMMHAIIIGVGLFNSQKIVKDKAVMIKNDSGKRKSLWKLIGSANFWSAL
jgi:hypothetical protein